jgi:hypothetical protein
MIKFDLKLEKSKQKYKIQNIQRQEAKIVAACFF